ncbi:MAG: hypothetical protein KDB53_18010, partial [Planctomycetes bacterium]|nr:hypothetical protein [Planctomycetota bacterium]
PVATTFAHEWRARQELRVRAELLRQNLSQGELVLQARFERNPELFAGARKEVFRDVDWARLDVYTASFEPELRAGTIVGPFYDTQGLVLMQFQTRDAEPAGPVRDLLRLTFAYRPDVDPAVQARRSLALARRARVRVVDEAWRPLVDPASTR